MSRMTNVPSDHERAEAIQAEITAMQRRQEEINAGGAEKRERAVARLEKQAQHMAHIAHQGDRVVNHIEVNGKMVPAEAYVEPTSHGAHPIPSDANTVTEAEIAAERADEGRMGAIDIRMMVEEMKNWEYRLKSAENTCLAHHRSEIEGVYAEAPSDEERVLSAKAGQIRESLKNVDSLLKIGENTAARAGLREIVEDLHKAEDDMRKLRVVESAKKKLETEWKCPICGEAFQTKAGLASHGRYKHAVKSLEEKKEFWDLYHKAQSPEE